MTVELDDGGLWQQASQGDPAAFGLLFERHVNAVYTHCFRRTGSWEAAEDLTSVVFLEGWRRRREVALSGESILPWLLAVANNVVRNRDRSLRRHRRLLAKLPASVVAPDPADDAVARVDDERAMQRVLQVFSRLLPDEQDVLALCIWAGLSYADAAVALGVPIGTVRSRLSRARAHLRRLADVGESDTDNTPGTRGATATSAPRSEQTVRTEGATAESRDVEPIESAEPAAAGAADEPSTTWQRRRSVRPAPQQAAARQSTGDPAGAQHRTTGRRLPIIGGLPFGAAAAGASVGGFGIQTSGPARNNDRRSR